MGLIVRKRIKLMPGIYLNLSRRGASVTADAGPVSVNSRSRRLRVDLPGPFSWASKPFGRRNSR